VIVRERQREREDGARADVTVHREVAAVRAGDPGGEGQAQPGVGLAAPTGRVYAVEGLEQVRQVSRLDARPRVAHRYRRLVTLTVAG